MIMAELLRLKPVGEPVAARGSVHKGGYPVDKAVDDLATEQALLWLTARRPERDDERPIHQRPRLQDASRPARPRRGQTLDQRDLLWL